MPFLNNLPPGDSPLDNPLKGWAAYSNPGDVHSLPTAMAYFYRSWRELEPKQGQYAFAEWGKLWDNPSARGKHVVLRVYLDYPKLPSGVPDWIVKRGVRMTPYTDQGGGQSPDYDDPRLLKPLLDFIAAFGARYDKHPRVAFVALGTLGFWGEWHTYPRSELFASPATQEKVVDAYQRAFPNKILLARYAGVAATGRAPRLGYHDDLFPQDTDGPEEWTFLNAMRRAGRTENWKRAAIGAEMVPNAAATYLGPKWEQTRSRVNAAHLSWVGPYCPACEERLAPQLQERAHQMVRSMGYSFRLIQADIHQNKSSSDILLHLEGVNEGVAPFYYPWPFEVALLTLKGDVLPMPLVNDVDIRRWLPGPFAVDLQIKAPTGFAGIARLGIGIRDPWTKKLAVRFANRLEMADDWAILQQIAVLK